MGVSVLQGMVFIFCSQIADWQGEDKRLVSGAENSAPRAGAASGGLRSHLRGLTLRSFGALPSAWVLLAFR